MRCVNSKQQVIMNLFQHKYSHFYLHLPCTELIQITLPALLSTIPGTNRFANAAPEKKLTCINFSSTSNFVSRKEDREDMPPLLINMSIAPEDCFASWRDIAANFSTEDLSPKSQTTISTFMDATDVLLFECSFAICKHSRCTSSSAASSRALNIKSEG